MATFRQFLADLFDSEVNTENFSIKCVLVALKAFVIILMYKSRVLVDIFADRKILKEFSLNIAVNIFKNFKTENKTKLNPN